MKYFVGIDVGATRMKAGLVDACHRVTNQEVVPIQEADRTEQALIDKLAELIPRVLDGKKPVAVGIGFAGVIERERLGMVCHAPNFPKIHDFMLKKRLEERIPYPVMIDNDANCVMAGEYLQGAAAGIPNFIGLTLGTGVGGAIVLHGSLWRGCSGMGGELGHMTVDPAGPMCADTGANGPLEIYPSLVGLRRMCREKPVDGVDPEDSNLPAILAEACEAGDATALEHYATAGAAMGQALGGLLNIFDVKTIILAGGVANNFKWMESATWSGIGKVAFPRIVEGVEIRVGTLGEKAGILGAAMQWMMQPHD